MMVSYCHQLSWCWLFKMGERSGQPPSVKPEGNMTVAWGHRFPVASRYPSSSFTQSKPSISLRNRHPSLLKPHSLHHHVSQNNPSSLSPRFAPTASKTEWLAFIHNSSPNRVTSVRHLLPKGHHGLSEAYACPLPSTFQCASRGTRTTGRGDGSSWVRMDGLLCLDLVGRAVSLWPLLRRSLPSWPASLVPIKAILQDFVPSQNVASLAVSRATFVLRV